MKKKHSNGSLVLPPVSRLRELFDYSVITGCLYHKTSGPNRRVGKVVGPIPNRWGYLNCKIDGVRYRQNRIIWKMVTGKDPGLLEVEHIDEDKSNNAWLNLRLATRSQNKANVKKRDGCSSRFKGVTWFEPSKKWMAYIRLNGKNKHLGYFDTEEEAWRAYCDAAREAFGEFFNDGFGSCLCA